MLGKLIDRFIGGSSRSRKAVRNIAVSLCSRGVSILCTFLIVPLTIEYLNSTMYGIWLAISSIVAWIAFFDLGLGNGFRNRFAEAKAKGDITLARQYLSTTYFAISAIVLLVFLLCIVANSFIDWSRILRIDNAYCDELHDVFIILSLFFCMNLVANVFSMLLTANQEPGKASLISTLGQVISLLVIYILVKTTEGSITNLAVYYAGIPCICLIVASLISFKFTTYRQFAPRFKDVKLNLVKDIVGKGVQFFIICVSSVVIFQMLNIVLSRELGPESVTQYNTASKYYLVLYMVMSLIVTPYWSAFTEAFISGDYMWMKATLKRLERVWLISVGFAVLMIAIAPMFFRLWVGDKVEVPLLLSVSVCFYVLSKTLGNIYMYVVNGIGTIRLQLILYILLAVLAWPALVWSCRWLGVYGISLYPAIACLSQAVLCKVQIGKLLGGTAHGLWLK